MKCFKKALFGFGAGFFITGNVCAELLRMCITMEGYHSLFSTVVDVAMLLWEYHQSSVVQAIFSFVKGDLCTLVIWIFGYLDLLHSIEYLSQYWCYHSWILVVSPQY